MSAYSDWKCGALSREEFKSAMAWECRGDNDCDYCECACYSCKHFVKGTETECDLPAGKCQNESEYEEKEDAKDEI